MCCSWWHTAIGFTSSLPKNRFSSEVLKMAKCSWHIPLLGGGWIYAHVGTAWMAWKRKNNSIFLRQIYSRPANLHTFICSVGWLLDPWKKHMVSFSTLQTCRFIHQWHGRRSSPCSLIKPWYGGNNLWYGGNNIFWNANTDNVLPREGLKQTDSRKEFVQ